MGWVAIIALIIEIVKLLLSLRKEKDSPELNAEFDHLCSAASAAGNASALRAFRDRLRARIKT